ncbi:MAG: hypothetical protein ACFWTP_02860 [Enterococcus gilvus]|jgi:hypothetical protein|uniref:hypothetical protein n=1 Tax=Enterococcus gilvus TaxID=160453 RepID=UPI0039F4A76D
MYDFFNKILQNLGGVSFFMLVVKIYLDFKKKVVLQEKQAEIENNLLEVQRKQDSVLFITNKQFEKEYEIYLELFDKLAELILRINGLFPGYEEIPRNEKRKKEYYKDKYFHCNNAYNALLKTQKKYGPFYQKNVRIKIEDILDLSNKQMKCFRNTKMSNNIEGMSKGYNFTNDEFPKSLKNLDEQIEVEVREYLKKLRTIDCITPS